MFVYHLIAQNLSAKMSVIRPASNKRRPRRPRSESHRIPSRLRTARGCETLGPLC